MAEKQARLAHDPALRLQMAEAGRRRVLQHFQVGDQLSRFEELYTRLLDLEKSHA